MAAKKSRAFQRFVRSLEAPISSYEDFQRYSQLDVAALEQLDEAELQEAHDRMIAELAKNADARVARVLSGFDSEAAMAALRDAYARYPNDPWDQGETAAEALLGLMRHDRIADPRAELHRFVAQAGPKGVARIAFDLGARDDDDSHQMLLGLLDHAEADVRRAAAEALLRRAGLAERAAVTGTREWLLLFQLSAKTPAVRRAARATLRELAERRGEKPGAERQDAPERSDALARFQDSLNSPPGSPPWAENFDLTALVALKGVERDWMEYALINRLDSGDARIPRALSVMESTLALEPLRAMLPQASGEMAKAVQTAIAELEGFVGA
jgi:hypothetical protein